MEWNKLDVKLRKSEFLPYFRNTLLKVVWPTDKLVPTAISGGMDISEALGCHLLRQISSQ